MGTRDDKITIKIVNEVGTHVCSALTTSNEHEIDPGGMIPMEQYGSPWPTTLHSDELEVLNHLLKNMFVCLGCSIIFRVKGLHMRWTLLQRRIEISCK